MNNASTRRAPAGSLVAGRVTAAHHEHPLLAKALLAVCAMLCVWLSLSYFVGAGYDDSWISLWSGERLVERGMLLNHNDQPVEIASSLLHVLMIAGFHALSPGNALLLNKLAGLIAGLGVLAAVYAHRDTFFGALPARWRTPALGMALVALATHPSWLNWNLGGLETPYQTLILTLHAAYLMRHVGRRRSRLALTVTQCLYVLVRSDGFTLVAATLGCLAVHALLVRRRQAAIDAVLAALAPIALVFALMAARYALFGLLAPAPAYAKAGSLSDLLEGVPFGIAYVRDFYASSPLMLAQALLLIGALTRIAVNTLSRPSKADASLPTVTVGMLLIAWNHAFVILVRGDWMSYFRFIAPVIPLLAIVSAQTLASMLAGLTRDGALERPAIAGAAAAMLLLSGLNQAQRPNSFVADLPAASLQNGIADVLANPHLPLKERVLRLNASYLRDSEQALPFLRDELPRLAAQNAGKKLVIVSYQIGYVPYITKRMHPALNIEFIDTMGLATPEIARMPLRKFIWGTAGGDQLDAIVAGELQPLSDFVNARQPDVLYFIAITPEQRARLAALGWRVLWDRPGAIFYGRP